MPYNAPSPDDDAYADHIAALAARYHDGVLLLAPLSSGRVALYTNFNGREIIGIYDDVPTKPELQALSAECLARGNREHAIFVEGRKRAAPAPAPRHDDATAILINEDDL